MSEVIHVSDADFQQTVISADKTVLLDFWAEWCGPCKALGPILEDLAADFADTAIIAKMDVDSNPDTSAQFGIRSIPTLIIFKNGEAVETLVGALPKAQLAQHLNKHL